MRIPKREEGQGLVEYALILVLVAIVIVVILSLMGRTLTTVYAQIIAGLNGQALDGSGTEYVVTAVNVSVAGGGGLCTVSLSGSVAVFEDGQLVGSGEAVSGSAFWDGNTGGTPISGSTNNNGTANMGPVNGSANCSGEAGITVAGNTKTVNFGN